MPFSPFVAAVILTGIQCGPSDQEIAGGVLIAAPVALALGWLFFRSLAAAVRRHSTEPAWDQRPVRAAIAASAIVAVATAIALSKTGAGKAAVPALWVYSASYLAILAGVWLAWARFDPGRAFTWAWLPVTVLQLVPAALVAANVMPADWVGVLWIWPGYFGLVTLVVVAVAWMEARRPRGGPPAP